MISLFAGEERDTKRQSLRDPLAVLTQHIDFLAIAAAVDAKLKLGASGRGGGAGFGGFPWRAEADGPEVAPTRGSAGIYADGAILDGLLPIYPRKEACPF